MNHVKLKDLMDQAPQCYSDYEELAFIDTDIYDKIVRTVKDFTRHDPQDRRELVLYHVAHVASSTYEVKGELSDEDLETICDTVSYTVDSLLTSQEFTRSGINWDE